MPNDRSPYGSIILRPAGPADTDALARIFVAAFQNGYPDVLPPEVLATVDVPSTIERFRIWNHAAGLQTVVAERVEDPGPACGTKTAGGTETAGVPLGFARFGADPDTPEDTSTGYLAALYVHPSGSGAGVGRALLNHACRTLAARGAQQIRLWVFRDNRRARRLYESAGFALDGRELTDPHWQVPQVGMRLAVGRDASHTGAAGQ